MRRLLSLIVLLALLAGCSAPSGASGDTSAADPAPEQTPADEAAPQTPAEPEPESEPTAGGVTVHTDYSNYTPFESPKAVYSRRSDEWMADFEAIPGGATLYPFAGSLLYSASDGSGYSWRSGAMYGLMDETGCIVADPTYTAIEQISLYNPDGTSECLPLWRLARSGPATVVAEDDWSYVEGGNLYAVAALDGSFVTACCYGYVSGLACGVLCMETYDADQFVLYGFDGEVLLTEQDLAFRDRLEPYSFGSIEYGDGLLLIKLTDGYYYMDLDGNLKLGPYASAQPFWGGFASVSLDDALFGIIDTTGAWRIEPAYESVGNAFQNGRIIVGNWDSSWRAVLDTSGRELFRKDVDYLWESTPFGYVGNQYSDQGTTTWYYDWDGNELFCDETSEWYQLYGTEYLSRESEDGEMELRSLLTGKTVQVEQASALNPLYVSFMDMSLSTLPYFVAIRTQEDNNVSRLLDASLSEVLDLGTGYASVLRDEITGDEYVLVSRDGTNQLLASDLTPIGRYQAAPTVRGGLIGVTDNWSCTWTDLAGSVVFCYPLTTSQDD